MGGNKNIIKYIVEHIGVEWASCLGKRGIRNIIKDVVEYIEVEEASCLSNRGIRNIIKILENILM